jgi:hypothetical protein
MQSFVASAWIGNNEDGYTTFYSERRQGDARSLKKKSKRLRGKLSKKQPKKITANEVAALMQKLVGLPCWYVSGGATGNTFSLALGAKLPRSSPLWPDDLDNVFSTNRGEASLYVWCSWRLDGPTDAISSSDQEPELFMLELRQLIGKKVDAVTVAHEACDLSIRFGSMVLNVFCDHVLPTPSFDGNWEATIDGVAVSVGPGFKAELEEVEEEATGAPSTS